MIKQTLAAAVMCGTLANVSAAIVYPGKNPGSSKTVTTKEGMYTLENNLISAKWQVKGGKLSAPECVNKLTGEKLSGGKNLFAVALKKQHVDKDWVYLGIKFSPEAIKAMLSMDGQNWSVLNKIDRAEFNGKPELIRVGKTDNKGGSNDYGAAGEMGVCEFLSVTAANGAGKNVVLTGKPARIHKSSRQGTVLAINNERGTITANANSTAFSEYKVPAGTDFFSCRIKKGSDKGMTWGPGLTLKLNDGKFVTLGIRGKDQYNLNSSLGENIIPFKVQTGLNCDLNSQKFKVSKVKVATGKSGSVLTAKLTNSATGISARWKAELKNGSSYIRQELVFSGTKKCTLYGLELLSFNAVNSRQEGSVPGSPVVTDSFFTGVEMPVTSNFVNDDGFRSGFGALLPIEKGAKYKFGSVVGVYPKGQLRRAFNFYLERERATKSSQFLHYNNWYDFAPEDKKFMEVIREYGKELTEKRGVKLDSFVMDDGWDNFMEGLWSFHKKRFPEGFTNVTRDAKAIDSNLGVWISPLGGYGGCNERTEHARKMGLIKDKLDLSQPGYYKWYRDKCLKLIRDYGVNYFKWDKAGSGVDPHFMALLRIAEELKVEKPDLYINVTVGTWPSPFWLNHIDCTWRDGSGDVAWHGKGDKRESWLTYRDMYCYRLCVKRAPLYPINSLMHHGLVIGHHYQGKDVAKAGADFKNAARSYFAMGPNLQELYLSTDLMTQKAWDQIAEAVKWSKRNKDVLVDAHWIGGDPGKAETYGAAAWKGGKGTLMFRNPDDVAKTITIDVAEAFELPKGAAASWKLRNAYADQKVDEPVLKVGQKHTFTLKPFEVLVFDAKAI